MGASPDAGMGDNGMEVKNLDSTRHSEYRSPKTVALRNYLWTISVEVRNRIAENTKDSARRAMGIPSIQVKGFIGRERLTAAEPKCSSSIGRRKRCGMQDTISDQRAKSSTATSAC